MSRGRLLECSVWFIGTFKLSTLSTMWLDAATTALLGAFVFSGLLWMLITYVLIFLRLYNKFDWLLDLWLKNPKYLKSKRSYFIAKQKILEFKELWQQHLIEGENVIGFKNKALALCDDYKSLFESPELSIKEQRRLKHLAHKLPSLPSLLQQKILDYEAQRKKLNQQWNSLNLNLMSYGLTSNFHGRTLFPDELEFNDAALKAKEYRSHLLTVILLFTVGMIQVWDKIAQDIAPSPIVMVAEEPKPVEQKPTLPLTSTKDWYALNKKREKVLLDSLERPIVVDTDQKLMWINILPEDSSAFYRHYLEPDANSVAVVWLLKYLNLDEKYMGYDDWRLPTSVELRRLALTQGVDKVFYYPLQGTYASGNKDGLDGLYVEFPSGKVDYDPKRVKLLLLVRNLGAEKITPIKPSYTYDNQRWQRLDQNGKIVSSDDYVGQREWCAEL